jgi:anti-sigma factor ChrR (cupin superfamily)
MGMDNQDPDVESMSARAAGTLDPVLHLMLETQDRMKPECATSGAISDHIAAAFFHDSQTFDLGPEALADVLSRLDELERDTECVEHAPSFFDYFPPDLMDMASRALNKDGWIKGGEGIEYLVLSLPRSELLANGGVALLVRMAPGSVGTTHRHLCDEYSLVLEGRMEANGVAWGRGDLIHYREGSVHTPRPTEGSGCTTFAILTGSIEPA